jgi:trans-2,3-dihydro-3-hydroxyanthranilate isomerase
LQISPLVARHYLDRMGARFFYCITRAHADAEADWHARMQFEQGEDPATGSAAGCAISYLVHHGVVASGQTIVIEQGVEILRSSRIHVSASIEDGIVTKVFVGGRTICVACGRFFLP